MNRRLGKYLIAGGVSASVEYGTFFLFHRLGILLLLANTLSFLLGLVTSFLFNRHWVFSSKQSMCRQFVHYAILAIVNVCIGNGMIWLLTTGLGVQALLAKLIVMGSIALWNYLFFSRIIFKDTPVSNL